MEKTTEAFTSGTKRKHHDDDHGDEIAVQTNNYCMIKNNKRNTDLREQNDDVARGVVTSSLSSSCPEMGYFWLSNCPLWVSENDEDDDDDDCTHYEKDEKRQEEWIDVKVISGSSSQLEGINMADDDNNNMGEVDTDKDKTDGSDFANDDCYEMPPYHYCHSCQVRLLNNPSNNNNNNNNSRTNKKSNHDVRSASLFYYQINLDTIPCFDGHMDHRKCDVDGCRNSNHNNDNDNNNNKKGSNRSDASLLFGLLRFCQEVIQIKQCSIIRKKESNVHKKQNKTGRGLCRDTFDMVITVTFPHWFDRYYDNKKQLRSIIPNAKYYYTKNKRMAPKCLHESTQCLLAMIQSDWKNMEQRKQVSLIRAQQQSLRSSSSSSYPCDLSSSATSIFPTALNLDELYKRIRGCNNNSNNNRHRDRNHRSTSQQQLKMDQCELRSSIQHHVDHEHKVQHGSEIIQQQVKQQRQGEMHQTPAESRQQEQRRNGQQQQQTVENLFQLLSMDVLTTNIAPYLRARSLYNLRCTCKYLFRALSTFVPGLNPKIHLYRHQRSSLQWLRQRERRQLDEYDCLVAGSTDATIDADDDDYTESDDYHRAATGGCTVRLAIRQPSSPSDHSNIPYVRIDQITGQEVAIPSPDGKDAELARRRLSRRVARGGLLCDDPGLGKTMTVLSLILQTNGLSTAKRRALSSGNTKNSEKVATLLNSNKKAAALETTEYANNSKEIIFDAYWSEQVVSVYREPALLRLLNDLCKLDNTRSLHKKLKAVKLLVSNHVLGREFESFQWQVENEIKQHSPNDNYLLEAFRDLVDNFKANQIRSAKKSVLNTKTVAPDSVVAALIEKEKIQRLIDSLEPSSGTLLVVPSVLMEHWQTQIELYVNMDYITAHDKLPLVFDYKKKDTSMSVDRATILCKLEKTHDPIIFFDQAGTRPLPPASFLAIFRIVITTTQRFMNEWKKGSFQKELEWHEKENNGSNSYRNMDWDSESDMEGDGESASCPLLKVHWLRMVVDEGHSMGHGRTNSTIQFASWIQAERRIAMTGTPTKQTDAQVTQIFNLLNFLQHEFCTLRNDGSDWWKKSITRNWREGHMVSFFRLRSLLGFLMKRHTKLDIIELESPRYTDTKIPMSFVEAKTYNTLVSSIQTNIVVTSMKGETSGLQDSLLHRSQTKNARLALANVRRVCVGYAHVVPTLSDKFFEMTIELAKEKYKFSEYLISEISDYIGRAKNEEMSECSCCAIRLPILLLMPCCGVLVCSECMDSSTLNCLECEAKFNVDELQKFQPGFEMNWKSSLELKPTFQHSRASEQLTQLVLPRTGSPSADEGPIIRPHQDRIRTRKPGDGHQCVYDLYSSDGKCMLCFEEHSSCNLLGASGRCDVCYRPGEECPEDESKSCYLVNKLLQLYKGPIISGRKFGESRLKKEARPLKVIVFSQFRAVLNVVGDRLLRKFGTACVAEYFGKHRTQELHRFTYEKDCFCLLLTKDGSEGLDLSFVTNIVFLEEIYDQSLRNQAVARAWRMGASGPVEVETLIANNTVEVDMRNLNGSRNESDSPSGSAVRGDDDGATFDDRQRLKALLLSLRFVTDYHQFGKNTVEQECSSYRNYEANNYKTTNNRSRNCHVFCSSKSANDDRQAQQKGRRVRFFLPGNY